MKSISRGLELKSAIVRNPLVVGSDTTVIDAIAHMSGVKTFCEMAKIVDQQYNAVHQDARSSCILVVEDKQLLGILTERDVVRLSAQQSPLENLLIRDVMINPVITLRESDFTDLLPAVNLMQKHKLRHLPIVNDQNKLVGLLTNDTLGQSSRDVDFLRLRLVSEVMTKKVICAPPASTMLEIAQLMAAKRVSCVVIVQGGSGPDQIPVGIVTERDIVQFRALGLRLEKYLAHIVMSTPLFTVSVDDSLWTVQQIMEQRLIRRLAITGDRGELLGIITQTSLLQALNPIELYKLAAVLEKKLVSLEDEKLKLLESRAIELEQQVESRTIVLKSQAEREKLASEIATQIRSSLSLQTILDNTVAKIRQILNCDRVNIWKFKPDWQAIAVAESTNSELSLVGEEIYDTCLAENCEAIYHQGKIRVVPDIHATEMSDCHRNFLIRLQTRSKILLPLFCGEQLWGLLNVTESQFAREWKPDEIELLTTLSGQIAIALQQATTHQKLQEELIERQQAEAQLKDSTQAIAKLNTELEQRVAQRTAELQEREAHLQEANQQLARATRLKDEFLANMSHELRTPLNAILGMTEGLQEQVFGIINQQQQKALQTIESSGSHLLELINDILDLAKIESGQIELNCEFKSINLLCQSSLAFIKQQALQKHIQLKLNLPPNLPNLLVDERRIRQVLINLLNNAVKFTPEGGCITLQVSDLPLITPMADCSRQQLVCIAVQDTGIGISPENINKLFQPFIQIDSALNRQYAGTGLGLSLVKRIVELHGGKVGLTSEIGVGSCFTIDLPCVVAEEFSSVVSTTEKNLTKITPLPPEILTQAPLILMAEDNESNIATISSYLEAKGYRIILANDGYEAVKLAKSHQPQVILMDIQMPRMDGLEATRQIRRDPNLAKTPIIALTALAMADDRSICLAAGADEYLSKPVKLRQLAATIENFLN